jgi:hypothetical protein
MALKKRRMNVKATISTAKIAPLNTRDVTNELVDAVVVAAVSTLLGVKHQCAHRRGDGGRNVHGEGVK